MGAAQYANVGLHGSIQDATPHALIQMLIDGFIERVNVAKLAMKRGDIALKGHSITRAMTILGGLKDGLDVERGGELAQNLGDLYAYMEQRLFQASASNDDAALDEVLGLMHSIKVAWDAIPPSFHAGRGAEAA
ncbi:MAG: flagellar export chaperone FliS [Halothiobacillaceae bacterium]|nr:MAG: flagellar export chaperone FliS [Halothiobacillaceae bacterium]